MAEIILPSGHIALVDESDLPLVAGNPWHAHKHGRCIYAVWEPYLGGGRRNDKKKRAFMHHRVLLPPAGMIVDHKNGDGLDNRRSNLRLCGHIQNMQNQHAVKGRVAFKGVGFDSHNRLDRFYHARIRVDRLRISLGHFTTPEEAAEAYDAAAVRFFGEFAFTNHAMGLL